MDVDLVSQKAERMFIFGAQEMQEMQETGLTLAQCSPDMITEI